jgi:beta-glucosidase
MPDPAFGLPSTEDLVLGRRMTHFNLLGVVEDSRLVAQWHNRLQELAASTPLGIPITISTDPRHHFTDNPGTAFNAGAVSQWPEPLGLAALRSVELVQRFADIARQEYLASGFRLALHPQVDLATEPRWSRIGATFGEDAELTSELAVAYVRGFQGDEVGPTSVSTMTKHFPGGGPQLDGEDPHFAYGREQVYPRQQPGVPPQTIRGRHQSRRLADHAVLRDADRDRTGAGCLRIQPWCGDWDVGRAVGI